ncbi:MAG: hypothetical protein ACE15F_22910 [bacterium]
MRRIIGWWAVIGLWAMGAEAQPVGIFDNQADIGEPAEIGMANFQDGKYQVDAVGTTIGNQSSTDQFHFVYKAMTGSFAIEAIPMHIDDVGRGGLMIRQDLDPDSVHGSWMITSSAAVSGTNSVDMSVHPTFRSVKGGATKRDGDPEPPDPALGGLTDDHTGKIRLERIGNSIRFYTYNKAGQKVFIQTEVIPMRDPVYVGLAATAEGSGFGVWEFTEVKIEEYPFTAERVLPTDTYQAGASLSPVTITARARAGQTVNAAVHEAAPAGATVSNAKAGAGTVTVNPDGTIDWVLSGFTGEATLTYDAKLGAGASGSWSGTFNDGVNPVSFVAGDAVLPKNPVFAWNTTPVPADPVFPTVIQVEQAIAPEDGSWGLGADPQLESGIFAVSVRTSAGQVLEIPIQIPKDGTYYFFGNVRGEDGNSDSFHFEIDEMPAGDDSSRWNINSDKAFAKEWVSSQTPAQDPRAFELTAGEHTIYIGNRENDASIDWLAVTTNRAIDPADVDLNARALITRTITKPLLDSGETQTEVKITLNLKAGVTDPAVVKEIPPAEFTVSSPAASHGTVTLESDGSLTWNATGASGEATLTYSCVAPVRTGAGGVYGILRGTLALGGEPASAISGDDHIGAAGAPAPSSGKKVFFFQNVDLNGLTDQFIMSDLRTMFGVEITRFSDTNAAGYEMPADLTGADLAYVSESVGSGNVAAMNYHANSAVPLISNEQALGDDLAFQSGVGNGNTSGMTLTIVDNTHPITQGFDLGPMYVYQDELPIGYLENPPAGIKVLATDTDNPNRAFLWVIEKGSTVNGTVSPGLRIATWVQLDGYANLTPAGRRLFAQIIAYALGMEPPVSRVEEFMLY